MRITSCLSCEWLDGLPVGNAVLSILKKDVTCRLAKVFSAACVYFEYKPNKYCKHYIIIGGGKAPKTAGALPVLSFAPVLSRLWEAGLFFVVLRSD